MLFEDTITEKRRTKGVGSNEGDTDTNTLPRRVFSAENRRTTQPMLSDDHGALVSQT